MGSSHFTTTQCFKTDVGCLLSDSSGKAQKDLGGNIISQRWRGSPNFPPKFLHPPILEVEGERDLGERKRKKRGVPTKQQLLCLREERSEKKDSEFGIVCGMEYFERGGLGGVSWDLLTGEFLTVDGQMNSVMEALVESGKARWKLTACL